MARILVIDESQQRAVEICSGLIKAGHQVAAVLPSALELVARIEEIKPDIILIEIESPSRDTLEHLAVMHRDMPRPVVMFSQDGERGTIRTAIQAGVAAYVVDGFDSDRLSAVVEVAVIHFEEHQLVKQELAATSRWSRCAWLPPHRATSPATASTSAKTRSSAKRAPASRCPRYKKDSSAAPHAARVSPK